MFEGTIGIFVVDLKDPLTQCPEHGEVPKLLPLLVAKKITIEVLVVAYYVILEMGGYGPQHRFGA